ncbi:MAG: hypothetical protein MJZ14_00830 [Paludibacteraceae bacterium]|nr:hypothetical protein [Paludibacteraceae bacterium]
MSSNDIVTKTIQENQNLFTKAVNKLNILDSFDKRLELANIALQYVWLNASCYYSSSSIEKVYIEYSNRIESFVDDDYVDDTCLIVLTTPYKFGGHTRVVERWIESDSIRRYSVLISDMADGSISDRLRNDVDASGGKIFILNQEVSYETKVKMMRKMASSFESVLLFVHMNDPLPIVAFANKNFRRPVGFYNHADHLFGVGYSVVDSLVEMREWGEKMSKNYRGVYSSHTIAVPSEHNTPSCSKKQARERLSISENSKIVLSVGTAFKFFPNEDVNLNSVFDAILSQNTNCYYYVIGVTNGMIPSWNYLSEKYGDRFRLLPSMSHDELMVHLVASDLLIDSLPVSGMTTMQDAVMCNVPILTTVSRVDWIKKGTGYCEDLEEMISNSLRCLSDENERIRLLEQTKISLIRMTGLDAFASKVHNYMDELKTLTHSIHDFNETPTSLIDADKRIYGMFANSPKSVKTKRCLNYYVNYPHWAARFMYVLYDIVDCNLNVLRGKIALRSRLKLFWNRYVKK